MGGGWKTDQGEPLAGDMMGLVEFVLEGPMTEQQVKDFHGALAALLRHSSFGKVTRKIRLKKGAV